MRKHRVRQRVSPGDKERAERIRGHEFTLERLLDKRDGRPPRGHASGGCYCGGDHSTPEPLTPDEEGLLESITLAIARLTGRGDGHRRDADGNDLCCGVMVESEVPVGPKLVCGRCGGPLDEDGVRFWMGNDPRMWRCTRCIREETAST